MNVLLISPAQSDFFDNHAVKRTNCAALALLAAYTPPGVQLRALNQQNGDEVYGHDGVDLVGISAMTPQINEGYRIAWHYRQRGAKVVIGGIHASVRPDEVLEHADAVCVGEGDLLWPQIVADAAAGTLQRRYEAPDLVPMEHVRPFRQDVFGNRRSTLDHGIIQTSRGCPYGCEFCITGNLFGKKYRFRPVENVVEEIKGIRNRILFIIDDNIFGSLSHARRLFEALVPLNKLWVGQASLDLATRDPELLKLAYRSGCRGLFIGIESVSDMSNNGSYKPVKLGAASLGEIGDRLRMVMRHKILVMSSIIFGFDQDDNSVFEKTLAFQQHVGLGLTSYCIMTPYPGTELFERLKKAGRILTEDWSLYNNSNVVFQPAQMTPSQLKEGSDWAGRSFYTWRSMLTRLPRNLSRLSYFVPLNLAYRRAEFNNHAPGSVPKQSRRGLNAWLRGELQS